MQRGGKEIHAGDNSGIQTRLARRKCDFKKSTTLKRD